MPMNPRLLRPTGQFNPKSIAGLAAWFDALDSASITLNGTTVSQWVDKSGSGRTLTQATAANQPLYVTSGINGRRSLEMDGGKTMTGNSNTISQPFTMYAVVRSNDTVTNRDIMSGGTSGTPPVLAVNSSEFVVVFAGTNLAATSGDVKTASVIAGLFDGSSSSGRHNGTQVSSGNAGTTAWSPSNTGLALGAFASGAVGRWSGLIGEILLYSGKHTAAQLAAVERYLGRKWGITVA
jgi:hypothetical protein